MGLFRKFFGASQNTKRISWFEFISDYLDLKFENNNIRKEFDDFIQKTHTENPTEDQFKEFIIFDLFIDYATFLTCFTKEESQLLLATLETNILARLIQKGYFPKPEKSDDRDWQEKLEDRFNEYLPCLEEFTQEGLKNWNVNRHFGSELGKKWSKNFTGDEKNPLIVYAATWLFLTRAKHVGQLLKSIKVVF
jgi:hypothetical protein